MKGDQTKTVFSTRKTIQNSLRPKPQKAEKYINSDVYQLRSLNCPIYRTNGDGHLTPDTTNIFKQYATIIATLDTPITY
jgi:hypothetical protein